MTRLKPGDPAPDFEAPDPNGNPVRLSTIVTPRVFIFFYPKANTSG